MQRILLHDKTNADLQYLVPNGLVSLELENFWVSAKIHIGAGSSWVVLVADIFTLWVELVDSIQKPRELSVDSVHSIVAPVSREHHIFGAFSPVVFLSHEVTETTETASGERLWSEISTITTFLP